jgi:chaperonin GroES
MSLKLLDDFVLVSIIEEQKGGIIIPDTAQQKSQIGHVVAVGPGRVDNDGKLIPMDVKIGNKIMFKKYGGTEINCSEIDAMNIKNAIVMKRSEILVIFWNNFNLIVYILIKF